MNELKYKIVVKIKLSKNKILKKKLTVVKLSPLHRTKASKKGRNVR